MQLFKWRLNWIFPMARMKIFNSLEEEAFESPPVFNSAERKRFFFLPLMLEDSIGGCKPEPPKIPPAARSRTCVRRSKFHSSSRCVAQDGAAICSNHYVIDMDSSSANTRISWSGLHFKLVGVSV